QKPPIPILNDQQPHIISFLSLIPIYQQPHISIHLIPHIHHPPNAIIDPLFIHLFQSPKQNPYKSFNMRITPLSSLATLHHSCLTERFASVIF
ncbi:phosphatidylglycerol lysyltransferase domain-containing protein, partial [Bacillus pumilus]|uniref:phosphatidylglycerol lysyltransferase domain-containing protein n=1 Tax=Bacillus pumilus TaxID=1408 RepID=UPI0011A4BFB1